MILYRENIVNCVYSSARLEGITVSYEDTRQLCGGIAVASLTIAETNKINNLHKGWDFILSTTEYPLDYVYLQSLNQIVNTALVVPDTKAVRPSSIQSKPA